jgi:hypothetical protein
MLGEIEISDARESAIGSVLNRHDAATVSCGRTISHSPRSGAIITSEIKGSCHRWGIWGLQLCFNSCLWENLTQDRALLESDLASLNSYLDEHFVSAW